MPRKCCVFACKTNYSSETSRSSKRVSVFRFPNNDSAADERERWIKAVPNANLIVNKNTVICEKHWPESYDTVCIRGKLRPKNPPSVWPGIPESQVPVPFPPKRTTKKSLAESRVALNDELHEFMSSDKFDFDSLKEALLNKRKTFACPIVCFCSDESNIIIQSEVSVNGIPSFLIKIYSTLRFMVYHNGVQCYVTTLSKNKLNVLDTWSKLEEAIRFLNVMEIDHKKIVLNQQITSMAPKPVGTKLYEPDMLIRAFEYFATSRSLYHRLRKDFQLPSVATLTRITSKISNVDESLFLNSVFNALPENQRLCIILQDEVYVKQMLLYHGGSLFGKSLDDPSKLAKTMLGIMIVCLYGGPKFLSRMIPISKLRADLLFDQVDKTTQNIDAASGAVTAIICDGNRINQAFFRLHQTVPNQPWCTVDGR